MKTWKITFLISTGLVVLAMVMSFFNYFFNPALKEAYAHIGFPDWFRVELGIAKLLGALALAIPVVPKKLKEWAYVGFFINFFSAFLAHYFAGDPVANQIPPIILLMILVVSYIGREKLSKIAPVKV